MTRKKLAILGAGSSGLVTLKFALEKLRHLDISCFEQTSETLGAWGRTYEGFVSTSTKYTTQFSCYRRYGSEVLARNNEQSDEFFRDNEYGSYLQSFVEDNQLAEFIYKNHVVEKIRKKENRWELTMSSEGKGKTELFDYLIICTGLAEKPKAVKAPVKTLLSLDEKKPISGKKVVVIGGGESASDIANRLASPSLENQVYLSLKTGVRVSPRYHPIKGVPSDFLRNRLLNSIHEDIRNVIGQKFVEARIKHREWFEYFFRSKRRKNGQAMELRDKRKYWDTKLTKRAKGNLFNMFHNKSDNFLDAVAEGRIEIIGGNVDDNYESYFDFDNADELQISPDYLVPMIGYQSNLTEISGGEIRARDFFLGCLHADYDNLWLIGFARPIIGNIPTISEMQARYVVGMIEGHYQRPLDIAVSHSSDRDALGARYPKLNTREMYPVDMIPYCNRLAKKMGTYPYLTRVKSIRRWIKISLSPFSTSHYLNEDFDPKFVESQKVYSPFIITILLLFIKLIDIPYTILSKVCGCGKTKRSAKNG